MDVKKVGSMKDFSGLLVALCACPQNTVLMSRQSVVVLVGISCICRAP